MENLEPRIIRYEDGEFFQIKGGESENARIYTKNFNSFTSNEVQVLKSKGVKKVIIMIQDDEDFKELNNTFSIVESFTDENKNQIMGLAFIILLLVIFISIYIL